jgi:hypothetical protein
VLVIGLKVAIHGSGRRSTAGSADFHPVAQSCVAAALSRRSPPWIDQWDSNPISGFQAD